MGIKQLYNDNLRKFPNEYGDVSVMLLRPYTKHVTSYLRDITDFLNNLPTTVSTNTILASFDIESLYSNIPHDLGIEAVNYWIDKYPGTLHLRFSKYFILDGMELIL